MYRYLQHHGVKGQQWGVRNGPPYPIEDKVLKKGTRLNSVSPFWNSDDYKKRTYKGKPVPMYTYNPNDEWDSAVYKGPFALYDQMYRGDMFLYDHKYETVKDLTMPTKKERIEEFKKLPRKELISDLKNTRDNLVKYKVGNEQEQKEYKDIDLDNLKTDDDFRIAYSIFNHAMEASFYYKSTAKYMENMAKKYDAMVDDNNQGVYNDAHDPIVIFNANKVLKSLSNTSMKDFDMESMLTPDKIDENYNKVKAELYKKGGRVKL